MKIGNKSISGLYKYKNGVTYELNDILYYQGMLYTVIASTYNGDLDPKESPACQSFIERLQENGQVVTSNNILPIVNNLINGLQLGGTITRINIYTMNDLDKYITNGVYSARCSLFSANSFESLLRVYRFNANNTTKILQEIVSYSDVRGESDEPVCPTTIWYRVGTVNGKIIDWSNLCSIVSAYDDKGYAIAVNNLLTADSIIKNNLSDISSKMTNGTHYILNKMPDGKYHLSDDRLGIVKVIFKVDNLQDNLTFDASAAQNNEIAVKSSAGNNYTIGVTNNNNEWVIDLSPVGDVLKVVELNV